jgi:recombination protein RecA
MEEGFQMMLAGIMAGIDLIIVDSVAAMVPAAELEKDIGDAAKVGGVAKPMSELLPKFMLWLTKYPQDKESGKPLPGAKGSALVFINQTRSLIQTSGGGGGGAPDNTNTTGGKALKFFAYVRLQLTRIGSEFIQRKDPLTGKDKRYPYGNQTKVKCVKSKCDAKQGHEVEIFIRYGDGIDNYYSVIQTACAQNIMKKDGAWLTYNGLRLQGRDKWRDHLKNDPKLFAELTSRVTSAVLATADTIPDEELSEEDRLMAEYNAATATGDDDEDEKDLAAEAAEILVSETGGVENPAS